MRRPRLTLVAVFAVLALMLVQPVATVPDLGGVNYFSQNIIPQNDYSLSQDPVQDLSQNEQYAVGYQRLERYGVSTYLGGGRWRYSTSLGQENVFDGNNYFRYIYNLTAKTVQIGRLIFTHKANGVIEINHTDTGNLIGDLKWYAQYYLTSQWNNFTFDNYEYLGASQNEDNATINQRWWSTNGELNVSYTYTNKNEMKMRALATSWYDGSLPVRVLWVLSNISITPEYTLVYQDSVPIGVELGSGQQIYWHDVTLNTPDLNINPVLDSENRRAAVVFGNQSSILSQYETMDIDPQYTVDADSDDCHWDDPYGTPVIDTVDTFHSFGNESSADFRAYVRFSIAIPRGSTILESNFYGYNIQDDAIVTHNAYRVDETNVGDLEADASIPSVDITPTVTFQGDGGAFDWTTINVTDLVQAQVSLSDWRTGYYIGLAFETPTYGATDSFAFEDYAHANSHESQLYIDYLEGDIYQSVMQSDDDDCYWTWNETETSWTITTNSISTNVREPAALGTYTALLRYQLDIPRGSTINSANITFYEWVDQGDNDVHIYRVDETNVVAVEDDTEFPSIDYSEYETWDTDGVGTEMTTHSITTLVQTQVDLSDWCTGMYMAFNLNQTDAGAGTHFQLEDYQSGYDNHSFISVDYTVGDIYQSPLLHDYDDDWWHYNETGDDWIHKTTSLEVYMNQYMAEYWYVASLRFQLAIPEGATINSANLTCYETYDDSVQNHSIYLIDETNVDSLEQDTSLPSIDYSQHVNWTWDGTAWEWKTVNVTDLVQTQVNLQDWCTGYYIGFHFNTTEAGAGTWRFEDYQQTTAANISYLSIDWTIGNIRQYPIADDIDDAYATTATGFSIVTTAPSVQYYNPTGPGDRHSYLRFYITASSGYEVNNATIHMSEWKDTGAGDLTFERVDGSHWKTAPENLVSQPTYDADASDSATSDGLDGVVDYYITNVFTDFYESSGFNGENYLGIVITSDNDESYQRYCYDISGYPKATNNTYVEIFLSGGEYDYVDNNDSDIDSSSDIGTHSSFTDQQSAPDSTYDTLTEADYGDGFWNWLEDHYDQENTDIDSYGDYGTQTNPTYANDSLNTLYMNLQEWNMVTSTNYEDWYQNYNTNVDGYADVGTETNPENAQDLGDADYMTLEEGDEGTSEIDYEDWFKSYTTDIDTYGDIGTETNPTYAMDLGGASYMTLQEANQGGGGETTEYIAEAFTDSVDRWNSETNAYDGDWGTYTYYTAGSLVTSDASPCAYASGFDTGAAGVGTITQVDIIVRMVITGLDTSDQWGISLDVGASTGTYLQAMNTANYALNNLTFTDVTEPNDATWSWADVRAAQIHFDVEKVGGGDKGDWYIYELSFKVTTSAASDYELNFEYQWTNANYTETNEEVCINVLAYQQTASETLKAWEWDGADWVALGTLSGNGWNNFTASYLSEGTYYIMVNDTLQSDEADQDTWSIDSIILHTWTAAVVDYELDFEYQWTNANYSETNEEVCINVLSYQQTASETLNVWEWNSGGGDWVSLGTLSGNGWNNFTASYLTGSTYYIKVNDTLQSDESDQDTWSIDSIIIHTWTTLTDDYELDFEYQWTSAAYTESVANVSIYVQTADQTAGENLKAWEWDGSDWVLLGTLTEDAWNNFTCTELDSATYYIKLNDTLQASDTTQDSWNIDLLTMNSWNTTNYRLDLEIQWTDINYTRTNEYICIYTGALDAEDLEVYIWNTTSTAWDSLWADLTASQWNNISVSALEGWASTDTLTLRFLDDNQTNDGSSQDTWQIDSSVFRSFSGLSEVKNLFESITIDETDYTQIDIVRTLFETINIAETVTTIGTFILNLFEALAIAFSLTTQKLIEKFLFEQITIVESITTVFAASQSLFETITVQESVTFVATYARNFFETISIQESVTLSASFVQNLFESLTIDEAVTLTVSRVLSLFESITIDETITTILSAVLNLYESITLSETITTAFSAVVNLFESITIDEAVTTTITKVLELFESITIDESITTVLSAVINLYENITINEAVTTAFNAVVNLFESITIGDTIYFGQDVIKNLFETITIVGVVTTAAGHTQNLFETVNLDESVTNVLGASRSLFETITIDESVSTAAAHALSLFEDMTISEAVSTEIAKVLQLFETITVDETVVTIFTAVKDLFETITIEETVSTSAGIVVNLFESITLDESVYAFQVILKNLFETIGIEESVTTVFGASRTLFESITIDDSVSFVSVFSRTLFETIGIQESVVTASGFVKTLFEEITIDEVVTTIAATSLNLFETITVNESVSTTLTAVLNLYENLTIDETVTNILSAVLNLFEQITIDETVTTIAATALNLFEQITVNESVSTVLGASRTLFESITVNESVTLTVVFSRTFFENITVSETVYLYVGYAKTLFESITIEESVTTIAATALNLFETISINESVTNTLSAVITLSESITIDEAITTVLSAVINLYESITIDEAVYPFIVIVKNLFESIGINETVTTATGVSRTLFETITVDESVTFVSVFSRTLFETINIGESVSLAAGFVKSLFEQITIDESVATIAATALNLYETITISDSVTTVFSAVLNLQESITINESVSTILSAVLNLYESITINESVELVQLIQKFLFEQIGIDESVTTGATFVRTFFENITIQDSVAVVGNFSITLFEAIIIYESVDAFIPAGLNYLNLFEVITIDESVRNSAGRTKSLFETINIDESITTVGVFTVTLFESINIVESVSLAASMVKDLFESIGIVETVTTIATRQLNLFESIGIAESVSTVSAFARTFYETITIVESVVTQFSGNYILNLFEVITISHNDPSQYFVYPIPSGPATPPVRPIPTIPGGVPPLPDVTFMFLYLPPSLLLIAVGYFAYRLYLNKEDKVKSRWDSGLERAARSIDKTPDYLGGLREWLEDNTD